MGASSRATVDRKQATGPIADRHAVLVTGEGSFSPSGARLTGPVDSVDKLAKLINWCTLDPKGAPPQIWLVGMQACELLGWTIDPGSEDDADRATLRARAADELADVITASLAPLVAAGWELRDNARPGHRIHLSRKAGKDSSMLDVVLEPYAWTVGTSGDHLGILGTESDDPDTSTELPEDDLAAAQELARRLTFCIEHLHVLPGPTAARTGAAVLDSIRRPRDRANNGLVVKEAGPLPPLNGALAGELEPAVLWTRMPREDDLDDADTLVTIDQRAAYLASAGMLDFGYGTPESVGGDAAENAVLAAKTTPFGLYRVTLPAGDSLTLPELLPLPHPHMRADQPVQTWVTAVSLDGLRAPVADGGAGLDLTDLAISEAWIYPHQGRALDKWAALLRQARKATVDPETDHTIDRAMKEFVGTCYKGYIGRMLDPDLWTSKWTVHHHQPTWRASIMAHARWRGRRAAMRIGATHDRWPLRSVTDSWVYAAAAGETIADDSPNLGKMVVEKTAPLADATIVDLMAATTYGQVRDALTAAYKAVQ